MASKIFIDGEHGTTGLQIRKRLSTRPDLEILSIPHEERHNADLRADYLQSADIAILCLPDDAAKEAVSMIKDTAKTRVIDASTAFRIHPDWVYGFGEMTKGQKERIRSARFVANPGCYPTGAIGLIRPLREAGILPGDYPITINAVSGYSGGGKQMIAQMEDTSREDAIHSAFFLYGLNLKHKHVPEITVHGQLESAPLFVPSVGRFAQGMIVNVPLHERFLKNGSVHVVYDAYQKHYAGQDIIKVMPLESAQKVGRLDPEELANTDLMKIYVFADEATGLINVSAVLDNLGKGASGAAVQNLDLMLGKA